ncbi:MAG: hypothetical protein ACI81V_000351 [Lentimonas sp.]
MGLPRVKRIDGLPRVKRIDGLPRVKRIDGLPRVKRIDGLPRVKRIDGLPDRGSTAVVRVAAVWLIHSVEFRHWMLQLKLLDGFHL